ncbi:XkdX family protein [Sporosarcina sp. FSL K6-1508]|uniref:XkdX family protein n=1 Tax=Sporosarcina sp. FSL K6-1508 TaxID=2921553 RepID=UPI0030F85170
MSFWEQAYGWGWVTTEQLRLIVITDKMPYGEITEDGFHRITGETFAQEEGID